MQVGPRVLAWAAELNKRLGLSMRKTCSLFEKLLGLKLTPGGLSQALDRVAQRCRGEYYRIFDQVRESPVVYADETSWWVGEAGWWLWTFTTPEATLYRVEQSRGNGIVRKTLGRDFPGVLVTDCGAMYDEINAASTSASPIICKRSSGRAILNRGGPAWKRSATSCSAGNCAGREIGRFKNA